MGSMQKGDDLVNVITNDQFGSNITSMLYISIEIISYILYPILKIPLENSFLTIANLTAVMRLRQINLKC